MSSSDVSGDRLTHGLHHRVGQWCRPGPRVSARHRTGCVRVKFEQTKSGNRLPRMSARVSALVLCIMNQFSVPLILVVLIDFVTLQNYEQSTDNPKLFGELLGECNNTWISICNHLLHSCGICRYRHISHISHHHSCY